VLDFIENERTDMTDCPIRVKGLVPGPLWETSFCLPANRGYDIQPNSRGYEMKITSGAMRPDGQKGAIRLKNIEVKVLDNDLEKAMRILKKKIQNDGLFKRLKLKKSYEKPSEFRRRKQREALRRQRVAAAKAARARRYR
jgi:small subunit ribosomal protein S21